jgi:hypothetical protein
MTRGCVLGRLWRGGSAGWPSARLGAGPRNVGRLGRYDWPTVAQTQKSPPPASTGGGPERKGGGRCY